MTRRGDIQALREAMAAIQPQKTAENRFGLGIDTVDAVLKGGLSRGALHEIMAEGAADAVAATGFVLGLCLRVHGVAEGDQRKGRVLWVRQLHCETETGKIYPPGLSAMGFSPQAFVHLRLKTATQVLRAGIEAAGCGQLDSVVIEPWGEPGELDLAATHRLVLAAEKSGVTVFLLHVVKTMKPSAASTRWRIGSLASRALAANAPGFPAFDIELLRHRGGRDGLRWHVEWNRDQQSFIKTGIEASLLRPVVSVSPDRSAVSSGDRQWRQAG